MPGVEVVHLGVSEPCTAALALYERLGFATWAAEDDGLRVDGRSVRLHHLVLQLEGGAGG